MREEYLLGGRGMTKWKTVLCAVNMANSLSVEEMPTAFRSDEWWGEFWREMGLQEAQRIRRRYENKA